MTEYVTYITIGNRENDLRDFMVKQYDITADQARSILDSEPYVGFKSPEDRYQWTKRVITKIKALRSSSAT